MSRRLLLGYQLFTGLSDTSTGVLLILDPAWTLRLMRLQVSQDALPFLSYVGAFVLSVGIACLYGAILATRSACLLLLDPNRAVLASLFYPVGVSLDSVALVAYPSLLAPAASAAERGRRAGWIYAIAGWFGSAMGIGMGQNLGRIPPLFVLLAGVAIVAPQMLAGIRRRRIEIAATLAILATAFCIERAGSSVEASGDGLSPAERGRAPFRRSLCHLSRPAGPDQKYLAGKLHKAPPQPPDRALSAPLCVDGRHCENRQIRPSRHGYAGS